MKYCPYCGEELLDENALFCAECGKQIPERKTQAEKENDTDTDPVVVPGATDQGQAEEIHRGERISQTVEEDAAEFPDCYDGYYDDVIPDDHGNVRTTVDKQLIKKIAVLGISVVLIIAACVAIMYIL